MLSLAHKMIIIQDKKQSSKTKGDNAKEQRKKKRAKARSSTLTEVKCTYTRKDDLSLEVNTVILEPFEISVQRELNNFGP